MAGGAVSDSQQWWCSHVHESDINLDEKQKRIFLSRTIINVHTSTAFVLLRSLIHHYFEPERCKKGFKIHNKDSPCNKCKNHQQNIHSSLNTMNFEIIKWALHSALCLYAVCREFINGSKELCLFVLPRSQCSGGGKRRMKNERFLEVLFLMNKLRKANFHFHLSQWTLPTKFHPPFMQIDYSVTFVRSKYKVSWLWPKKLLFLWRDKRPFVTT